METNDFVCVSLHLYKLIKSTARDKLRLTSRNFIVLKHCFIKRHDLFRVLLIKRAVIRMAVIQRAVIQRFNACNLAEYVLKTHGNKSALSPGLFYMFFVFSMFLTGPNKGLEIKLCIDYKPV